MSKCIFDPELLELDMAVFQGEVADELAWVEAAEALMTVVEDDADEVVLILPNWQEWLLLLRSPATKK